MLRFFRSMFWTALFGHVLLLLAPAPAPKSETKGNQEGLPDLILPENAILRNGLSRAGGGALNVQTCVEVIARSQGNESLRGFQEWCRGKQGGSTPEKNRSQIKEFCEEKQVPSPWIIEKVIEEGSRQNRVAEVMLFLADSVRNGHWPMVSYSGGRESRYKAKVLSVVIVCHLDDKWACIFDPNWVEPEVRYEWIPREVLEERICFEGDYIWALALVSRGVN